MNGTVCPSKASLTPTLVSRLRMLWRHISKSRTHFETTPDTGKNSRSSFCQFCVMFPNITYFKFFLYNGTWRVSELNLILYPQASLVKELQDIWIVLGTMSWKALLAHYFSQLFSLSLVFLCLWDQWQLLLPHPSGKSWSLNRLWEQFWLNGYQTSYEVGNLSGSWSNIIM